MKYFLKYLSHFWYVAVNWDLWMAFFMAYDNIRGSRLYGSGTFIPADLKDMTISGDNVSKGSRYEPVSFYMLEKLFSGFRKISNDPALVDLGCGKGRALMVAPHFGFNELTGIDFAKEVTDIAASNMKKTELIFPEIKCRVINDDILNYEIRAEDAVFFMFNPFDEMILKKFLDKLDVSCNNFPRTVYFLYASPQHKKVLMDRGFAIIYEKKKMYLESIIAIRDIDQTGITGV